MTATHLVLLRHGQTDYNRHGRFQGRIDIGLNAIGRAQARGAQGALLHRLRLFGGWEPGGSQRGPQKLLVVSSPLSRARETVVPLAQSVGVAVQTDDDLVERYYGVFEGLTIHQIASTYPEHYRTWQRTGECAAARVEAVAAVGQRVAGAIERWAGRVADGGALVVASHGGALTRGISRLLDLDPTQWAGLRGLDNAHWAELIPGARGVRWRLAAYNLGAAESSLPVDLAARA